MNMTRNVQLRIKPDDSVIMDCIQAVGNGN
jgi:hypothetical protein